MPIGKEVKQYRHIPTGSIRTRNYEPLLNNLIYMLFVLFFCGLAALGLALAYGFYLEHRLATLASFSNSTDTYLFNAMNPIKLEYVWPENVEKIVNSIVDNNMHGSNDDRAVLIKNELARFKTTDVFYIMVYDYTQSPLHHAFYGNQSDYITLFKPGKCNVVVYRSHFWTGSPDSDTIFTEVHQACKRGIREKPDYSDTLKELFANFHNIQFLGLVDPKLEVSIRSARSFLYAYGPGSWGYN